MCKNIGIIWENILKHENEIFTTVTGISYTYTVGNDFILINNDRRRLITREEIERSLLIENPSPSKIKSEGIWGPSYVYGIITNSRINTQTT